MTADLLESAVEREERKINGIVVLIGKLTCEEELYEMHLAAFAGKGQEKATNPYSPADLARGELTDSKQGESFYGNHASERLSRHLPPLS